MPAGNQTAFSIEYVAIRFVTLPEHREITPFPPLHQPAVGNIGKHKRVSVVQPNRTFGELHAPGKFRDPATWCDQRLPFVGTDAVRCQQNEYDAEKKSIRDGASRCGFCRVISEADLSYTGLSTR